MPDILDEARWEVEFILKMQVPDGRAGAGMVHHKMHDQNWTGLPLRPEADPQLRLLSAPSTAATLNLAAVAAQASRVWRSIDPAFSSRALTAAEKAYAAAKSNPVRLADPNDGNGGGTYYGQQRDRRILLGGRRALHHHGKFDVSQRSDELIVLSRDGVHPARIRLVVHERPRRHLARDRSQRPFCIGRCRDAIGVREFRRSAPHSGKQPGLSRAGVSLRLGIKRRGREQRHHPRARVRLHRATEISAPASTRRSTTC